MVNENQHGAFRTSVPDAAAAGQFLLGGTTPVNRMGYGAMRLSGPEHAAGTGLAARPIPQRVGDPQHLVAGASGRTTSSRRRSL
jgi:hypothetical protein